MKSINYSDAISYFREVFPFTFGKLHDAIHIILYTQDKHTIKGRSFICCRCMGENMDHFMLTDEVWQAVMGRDPRGMLHLKCVEEKLGRKLRKSDFKDIPMNAQARYFASES